MWLLLLSIVGGGIKLGLQGNQKYSLSLLDVVFVNAQGYAAVPEGRTIWQGCIHRLKLHD